MIVGSKLTPGIADKAKTRCPNTRLSASGGSLEAPIDASIGCST